MTDNSADFGNYVRRVRELTQRYFKDLLSENDQLVGMVQSLGAETYRLQREAATLRTELERQIASHGTVVERLASVEAAHQAAHERHAEVEQMNCNLANLFVASHRIHASLERDEVLATLQEILINLVGSEDFAILERADEGSPLRLTSSFGIGADRAARLDTAASLIREALSQGAICQAPATSGAESAGAEDPPMVCIPLRVGDRVTGVIAIYRLLEHKTELEPLDRELFTLLSTHAGAALLCSALHAERGQALGVQQ